MPYSPVPPKLKEASILQLHKEKEYLLNFRLSRNKIVSTFRDGKDIKNAKTQIYK